MPDLDPAGWREAAGRSRDNRRRLEVRPACAGTGEQVVFDPIVALHGVDAETLEFDSCDQLVELLRKADPNILARLHTQFGHDEGEICELLDDLACMNGQSATANLENGNAAAAVQAIRAYWEGNP